MTQIRDHSHERLAQIVEAQEWQIADLQREIERLRAMLSNDLAADMLDNYLAICDMQRVEIERLREAAEKARKA